VLTLFLFQTVVSYVWHTLYAWQILYHEETEFKLP